MLNTVNNSNPYFVFVLVNNISYVGYKFYFKANCCLEAYTVNKIFMEHAFKLADTQNINEDQAMVKHFYK